jgi:hypothetical protein
LSLASNLVIQTLGNGRLKAFTADKGEQLLDIALPLNSGVGPPMTYMLDGKQYIAVFAGTGAPPRRGGPGGPGGPPPAGATTLEPTAAAAQAGNAPPAPAPPVVNTNPKLLVYAVPN